MIKKLLLCLLFSAAVLSLSIPAKQATNGFRVGKLAFDTPYNPSWDAKPSSEEGVQAAFNRPFRYLSHGAQSFVFASEDNRYILKLFRGDCWAHPWRLYLRRLLPHKKRRLPLEKKMERLFSACALAYTKAKDLTGLVYIHLNPTQSLPKSVFIDCLGRRYTLDLNRVRFAVQERGKPLSQVLLDADPQRLERLTRSFTELLEERTRRGISNSDPKVYSNFGFIGDRAIEWDFGNYWLDDELQEEAKRQAEIAIFVGKFQQFLTRHSKVTHLLQDQIDKGLDGEKLGLRTG